MLAYFLILVALILVNGLFAMAELSLFSSRGTRLKQQAKEGSRCSTTRRASCRRCSSTSR
jgi:CBS domain containing-hemolysin-like protein